MSQGPPLRLPLRRTDAHKGDFGRALLVGGSRGMSGSIALSAIAALRTGAGLVTVAVPDRCLETVASFHPGIMTIPLPDDSAGQFSSEAATELVGHLANASAIGCGPGMTTEPGSVRIVQRLLSIKTIPRVLDADAINCIAIDRMIQEVDDLGPIVLTPHPGELQRLTGVSAADRPAQIEAAERLASDLGVVVVVKGGPTVVASKDESSANPVWTNTTGNPGMATAGSGDVLTGVITALLAQGLSPSDAARLGVWVHGRAGDLAAQLHGQPGMTAIEILDAIPVAITGIFS